MRQRGGAGRWETAPIWVAAIAVGAFLADLGLRFGAVVDGVYNNSDFASTPVIAELLGDRGGGGVTLGNYPWIEPLYVLRLTRWLPDHIDAWSLLPFAGYACAVALFAWTLRRTVSTRAAVVAALALACPAPLVLGLLGAPANRLPSLAHAILLAAFLVVLPGLASRPAWVRAAWAAGLAVSLAPGVASDQLLIVWAVIPFGVAVAAGWRLALVRGRDAALAAAACAGGVLGGQLIVAIAAGAGIEKAEFPIGLSPPDRWAAHAWDLLESVSQFLHGEFLLDCVNEPLAAGMSVMAVVATASLPLILGAALLRLRGDLGDAARPPAQRLLLVFWTTSLAAAATALIISDVAAGISSVRYVLIAWPAALALALILWGRWAPPAVALVAAACAALGVWQLERGLYDSQGPAFEEEEIAGVERFVTENRLDHGYAGYWDAAPITYHSGFRARTYPVVVCGSNGGGFCEFNLHTMDSWYEPEPGERTFLVYGTRDVPQNLKPPPARWGRPFARARVGRFRLYAYGYDIASVLAEGERPSAAQLRENELAAASAGPGSRRSGGSSSPPRAAAPRS